MRRAQLKVWIHFQRKLFETFRYWLPKRACFVTIFFRSLTKKWGTHASFFPFKFHLFKKKIVNWVLSFIERNCFSPVAFVLLLPIFSFYLSARKVVPFQISRSFKRNSPFSFSKLEAEENRFTDDWPLTLFPRRHIFRKMSQHRDDWTPIRFPD